MKASIVFLAILVIFTSCQSNIEPLSPEDFSVLSDDGKVELYIIQKHDMNTKNDSYVEYETEISLCPIQSEQGEYQVITSIEVFSSRMKTKRGIHIGDLEEGVTKKYGEAGKAFNDNGLECIRYTLVEFDPGERGELYPFIGSFVLDFILKEGKVTMITIRNEYGF